jgi:hypothetical protein
MSCVGRAAISEEATASFLRAVYAMPCTIHEAASGQPCWCSPKAVCGARITGLKMKMITVSTARPERIRTKREAR